MIASRGGHVKCAEVLLDKGARVDLQDAVRAVLQSIIVCLACSVV